MFDFTLFSKLISNTSAILILQQTGIDKLDYYLIGTTINYSVVTKGCCSGNINKTQITLEINLVSVIKLFASNIQFTLKVVDNVAEFTSTNNSIHKLKIRPLCIEIENDILKQLISNLSDFLLALEKNIYNGRDLPSYCKGTVYPVSFSDFKSIASLASKTKDILHFCSSYACLDYKTAYIIQKGNCPNISINGHLLYTLLLDNGSFYIYNNLLYYKSNNSNTYVSINFYLPSITIDTSILSKGAILEYYEIDSKDLITLLNQISPLFTNISLNMSEGKLFLTNDSKEELEFSFSVKTLNSVLLEKYKEKKCDISNLSFSVITIPLFIAKFLNIFSGSVSIYVKKRKVIFKKDNLYLIFGRTV